MRQPMMSTAITKTNSTATTAPTITSPMSLSFLEFASWWTGVATLVFTGAAALAGVFAWFFSTKLSEIKEAEATRFQSEARVSIAKAEENAAELRVRAASAEARLLELRKRVSWRQLPDSFVAALKTRPKGAAEIICQPDDDEAYAFSMNIWHALLAAGWSIPSQPTQSASPEPADSHNRPFMLREAGISISDWSTVVVLSGSSLAEKPYNRNTPLDALMFAFEAAGLPALQTVPHETLRPNGDVLRIVVGSRL